jgi:hypothetical protein
VDKNEAALLYLLRCRSRVIDIPMKLIGTLMTLVLYADLNNKTSYCELDDNIWLLLLFLFHLVNFTQQSSVSPSPG